MPCALHLYCQARSHSATPITPDRARRPQQPDAAPAVRRAGARGPAGAPISSHDHRRRGHRDDVRRTTTAHREPESRPDRDRRSPSARATGWWPSIRSPTYPPEAQDVQPRLTTYPSPSAETIVGLKPDLVLSLADKRRGPGPDPSPGHPRVEAVAEGLRRDGQTIQTLGALLGDADSANAIGC